MSIGTDGGASELGLGGFDQSRGLIGDAASEVQVVRSEERLAISTETYATERVRLERFVVTEEQTITVTLRHEEVRMTREPLTAAVDLPGADAGHVMILREERLVLTKDIVPVERVWLEKSTVLEQVSVVEDVRHEEIDLVPPSTEASRSTY